MTRPKYVDVYQKLIEDSVDGKIRYKCKVKYVYTPQRQSMLPLNLEMLLFLRANEEIWNRNFVCDALRKAKTNDVVPL